MLDDIKKTLWATADKLRAKLTRRFADKSDDYFLQDADAMLAGV